TLCAMLIVLLFVHLQCGGSCLAESLRLETHPPSTSAEPPCHQHSQTPTNDQSSNHAEGTCTQGPLIDSKFSAGTVMLQWDATLPGAIGTGQPSDFDIFRYTPADPVILFHPPVSISVRRI